MERLLGISQEIRELGIRGTSFRVKWELRARLRAWYADPSLPVDLGAYAEPAAHVEWLRHLPLADAPSVAAAVHLPAETVAGLTRTADDAVRGRIVMFGRWLAEYGEPVDWRVNPVIGSRWFDIGNALLDATSAAAPGDIKFTWEIARFPQAYSIARAAARMPAHAERWAEGLIGQVRHFVSSNPAATGVHWTSGQETGFRLLAWLFAADVLFSRTRFAKEAASVIGEALIAGATYIEQDLDYARIAVYNNHLLSEALALFAAGALLPDAPRSQQWRRTGREILDEESERQFYADGGYIQQSHNYHRVALQDLLWACAFARSMGDAPSRSWLRAMERSVDFLLAHQNPHDGRLPNYGSNDGSLPSPLTSCDFSDFRPTLQAASLVTRGERLYAAGPWDEEAAWFLGPKALDAPQRRAHRASVSFVSTGYHVLRGRDEASLGAFRCGSLRDRFSQIDMLHLDVWWRGFNVLVDGGSFQYNAAHEWHNHFMRTASHNTVEVDGRDQMLHFRQFKVLYWTQAALLTFQEHDRWSLAEGEHYGYRRQPGKCTHRRAVLYLKDDLWIVVDTIAGSGEHRARLQWLGGEFPWAENADGNGFELQTTEGSFSLRVLNTEGRAIRGDVVAGQETPPRGWLSRYYGEKVPVPSFAATVAGNAPLAFVSILSGLACEITCRGSRWEVVGKDLAATFKLSDGRFADVSVA